MNYLLSHDVDVQLENKWLPPWTLCGLKSTEQPTFQPKKEGKSKVPNQIKFAVEYNKIFLPPPGTFQIGLLRFIEVIRRILIRIHSQCFGSIFIESGSGFSKKSQSGSGSGSRKALNPDQDPSYFFKLSEKKLKLCYYYKFLSSKEVN